MRKKSRKDLGKGAYSTRKVARNKACKYARNVARKYGRKCVKKAKRK